MTYNYKDILRRELSLKIALNGKYSLRAMARDCAISASRLSEILNGKQGLSIGKAIAISRLLKLSANDSTFFLASVESLHSKNPKKKLAAKKLLATLSPSIKYQKFSNDYFKFIADWKSLALLYLCETKNFNSDVQWISQKLDLSIAKTQDIIDRLIRLGLVKIEGGVFKTTSGYFSVSADAPSKMIQEFHKQVLNRAINSIDNDPMEEREIVSVVLSASKHDIERVRELAKEFRRSVVNLLDRSSTKDGVYALGFQFFEITNPVFPKGANQPSF